MTRDFMCHDTLTPQAQALTLLGISRKTLWRWRGLIGHQATGDNVEFTSEEMAKLYAIRDLVSRLKSQGVGQRAIMPAIYEMLRNWNATN